MHRISLRGPWELSNVGDRLEARRKFHAPKGMADETTNPQGLIDKNQVRESLFFRWITASEWPIDCLHFNQSQLHCQVPVITTGQTQGFFSLDLVTGVGEVDLTSILLPFNVIVLVWKRWPKELQWTSGRYTPNPQHPLHFDSWLDIDEKLPTDSF